MHLRINLLHLISARFLFPYWFSNLLISVYHAPSICQSISHIFFTLFIYNHLHFSPQPPSFHFSLNGLFLLIQLLFLKLFLPSFYIEVPIPGRSQRRHNSFYIKMLDNIFPASPHAYKAVLSMGETEGQRDAGRGESGPY